MGQQPASVPKTTRRVPQISVAHDIIAVEDAPGLVTTQFHCYALRDAAVRCYANARSEAS